MLIYAVILIGIIGGISFFIKGSAKKSFFLICLGINLFIIPLSVFIGIMATDAPDSDSIDFLTGFLFIHGIPLVLLIISIFSMLIPMKGVKKK